MDDLTGSQLNDYQVLRLLGRGAMASVYLAEQASLRRRVAVKVLKEELARNAASVDRFRHEARAAAALVHANIVQVYEVGCHDGRHFLAQEYVAGGTLGATVERDGPMPAHRALAVLWQVGSALAVAAERGVVHRDIKPDNLMVDRSGAVKVADFGLARLVEPDSPRLTQEGLTMGTPLYMSPEQVEGKPLDSRSDLYSLGATVYHLVAGAPPFDGDTPLAAAARRLTQAPEPLATRRPDLPPELIGVIDRLLRRRPEDRFASPTELLEELRRVARVAEQQGWAAAGTVDSGGLSASVAAAASPVDTRLTERLAVAMRAETESRRRSRSGRWIARLLAGVVAGALVAWLVGREPIVPPRQPDVQREASVEAQLYRAKVVGTAEAWSAVERYFPEAPEFYHLLARRGYAVDRLLAGEANEALPALERLADRASDHPEFGLFGKAGLVVAYGMLDREDDARRALGSLPTEAAGRLRSQSPQLADALGRTVRRLNADAG